MEPTSQIVSRYEIIEEIARGGMATVYKAYDPRLERIVALKIPLPQYAQDRLFVRRFLREARTAAKLEHPNIITIFDVDEHDGMPYFTMQYVGQTLQELLEKRGPLPLAEAMPLVNQIASALDYAHARGIVHRDVKPTNILLKQEGQAILADFGIAKAADGVRLTRTGELVGSPPYMSPEQVQGLDVDCLSDIYSLGVVCYEMLTGRPPFTGPTATVLHSHVHEPPTPLHTVNPQVPVAVERVVLKALAKQKQNRYASAGDMATGLTLALTSKTTAELPAIPGRRRAIEPKSAAVAPWKRVRGLLAVPTPMLAALIGVVALVAVVFALSNGDGDPGTVATPTWHSRTPPVSIDSSKTPTATSTRSPSTPTATPTATATPSPTPIPERIAFVSERDGNWEIYAMNADGTGVTRLTHHPAFDACPSWSPDARRIVFQSERDGNWELYIMNGDGSGLARLINSPGDERWPSWSPDGRRIAYVSDRDGNWEIYVMNVDSGQQVRLTANPKGDASPSWSPDGSRIVFSSNRDGNWEIYAMNADGSRQARLTYSPARDSGPSWSPDGGRIAFASYRDGNGEIYVMNADGSAQTNLSRSPASDIGTCWSRDGRRLAFESDRDGNFEIYAINADGSGITRLTHTSADDQWPNWAPG